MGGSLCCRVVADACVPVVWQDLLRNVVVDVPPQSSDAENLSHPDWSTCQRSCRITESGSGRTMHIRGSRVARMPRQTLPKHAADSPESQTLYRNRVVAHHSDMLPGRSPIPVAAQPSTPHPAYVGHSRWRQQEFP